MEHRAANEAASADEHLAAAQRAESAATAAHDLHPGDACPICRRDLPADWETPDGAGLADAKQVANAAREAAKEAANGVTVVETERKGIQRQVAAAEARLVASETRFQEARRELAEQVEFDTYIALPEREELLAPLAATCKETSERLAEHDRIAEGLRDDAARAARAPDLPAGLVMRVGSSVFVPQFEGEGHGDELSVAVPHQLRAGRVARAPEPPAEAHDQTDGVAEARGWRQRARAGEGGE